MPAPSDDTAPKPAEPASAARPEPDQELEDELNRVLFDHEMERGPTTRIPQPRRRRRLLRP